jgi:glucose/arabinose dehydrogenase
MTGRQVLSCYPSSSLACMLFSSCLIAFLILVSISNGYHCNYQNTFTAYAAYTKATVASGGPTIDDPNLKVDAVVKGLQLPTSMAFLGPNDILVLEKNAGTVVRIVDGEILKKPLLHIAVPLGVEYGMLGIAVAKNVNSDGGRNVFLYYTESDDGGTPHNRLYKYELTSDNSQLINSKLLLDLPAISSSTIGENNNHNGGKVIIGLDNNVYTVIGDVGGHEGQAQNVKNGDPLDGTSGIFRLTQDGQPAADNPLISDGGSTDHSNSSKHGKSGGEEVGTSFSASSFLNYYYAYGIRNSFGIDFDPVTGKLWDTENGPTFGDEIDFVNPGFNSGWSQVTGIWKAGPSPGSMIGDDTNNPPKNLVTFGGKGVYRAPEFSWLPTIGPTALKFLNSVKLGAQYQNDMFVGDVNTGSLYHFKLNQQRDGLTLTGDLADKVANTPEESQQAALGHGFGTITDLQVGPDGYLYVLTIAGNIYRISSGSSSSSFHSSATHNNNGESNSNKNTEAAHDDGSSSSGDNTTPGVLHEVPDNGRNDKSNHVLTPFR